MQRILFLAFLGLFVSSVMADDEASPILYITAGGAWYAKSVPSGSAQNREEGKTLVFLAGPERDSLECTFDWYSPRIFITGAGGGFSVVRLGPWPRGRRASHSDLGISFYRDGKLLKRYSTLDLAGSAENVDSSVSHYSIFKEVVGFVTIFKKSGRDVLTNDPDYGFEVVLRDDSHVVFDPKTGARIPISNSMFTQRAPAY